MNSLEVKNLTVSIEGEVILKDFSLTVPQGEVHALMGPNGTGKSTLAKVMAGHEDYTVESGEILLAGESILGKEADEISHAGLFLAFQYPLEIPGVATMTFLKTALNSQRKARGEGELTTPDFMRRVKAAAADLKIDAAMLKRPLNVGFSGGEKKRAEMVQMGILDPAFAVLDETDSGLDIDALRVVGDGINAIMRNPEKGVLLITHYQRLLEVVEPTHVSILSKGRIVKTGGPELASDLEREGYDAVMENA